MLSHHVTRHVTAMSRAPLSSKRKENKNKNKNKIPIKSENKIKIKIKIVPVQRIP